MAQPKRRPPHPVTDEHRRSDDADAGEEGVPHSRVAKQRGDERWDAIVFNECVYYFEDPVAWLEAAAPALKKTGRLVITNRIHHKAQSLAAAEKAGLIKVSESSPGPSHFIAVYKRKE